MQLGEPYWCAQQVGLSRSEPYCQIYIYSRTILIFPQLHSAAHQLFISDLNRSVKLYSRPNRTHLFITRGGHGPTEPCGLERSNLHRHSPATRQTDTVRLTVEPVQCWLLASSNVIFGLGRPLKLEKIPALASKPTFEVRSSD